MTPWNNKKRVSNLLIQICCVMAGCVIICPVLYCISMAFMRPSEIISSPPTLIPGSLYLENFYIALQRTQIMRFIGNSLLVSVICSLVRIVTASLAGYSFAFFDFRGKKFLFYIVLGTMLIPADATIITNYFTVSHMGLVDNYLGIMILYFVSAMNVFLIRQYFMSISKELKDAAEIDGCGSFRFYTQVLLPVSQPVLVTVFISSFVSTWNMYLWPLLITNKGEMRTVQVGITMLNFAEEASYGATMAGAVIVLVPSLLVFLIFQKHIVRGMTSGSVKG